jgi:uncharacterized protein
MTANPALATKLQLAERIQAVDWDSVSRDLDAQGNATINRLLSSEECEGLINLYPKNDSFRSTIVMARHGFGLGEYNTSAIRCRI